MKIVKAILPYVIIVVVVVLIRTFFVTPVQVIGHSMYPNLKPDDVLLLNKTVRYSDNSLKRFDIVVVKYGKGPIIKRVIGLPGEKIEYIDNVLYVDGTIIDENFTHDVTSDFSIEKFDVDKIPDDSYLVLGDNRGISNDGRDIGFINKKDIIGRVFVRLLPLNRIGVIK